MTPIKSGQVRIRRGRGILALLLGAMALSACQEWAHTPQDWRYASRDAREVPHIVSSPVTKNTTPVDPAFACIAEQINRHGRRHLRITAGDVRDLTGKYNEADGGNVVTQGGSLMVMSALGKMQSAITVIERVDTSIPDRELQYMDRRQLGDGSRHRVPGEEETVPWIPYFGGTVLRTDYYIVGGITEVNWNIGSGGAEGRVSGLGLRSRSLTMNIAVDLRIVDTRDMRVVRTTSLQKQIIGREVGAEVFRFFGHYLFDINTGRRMQEPLQLAVRTTLELAVIDLIVAVTRIDPKPCARWLPRGGSA